MQVGNAAGAHWRFKSPMALSVKSRSMLLDIIPKIGVVHGDIWNGSWPRELDSRTRNWTIDEGDGRGVNTRYLGREKKEGLRR